MKRINTGHVQTPLQVNEYIPGRREFVCGEPKQHDVFPTALRDCPNGYA
jgi:hypothetical protein